MSSASLLTSAQIKQGRRHLVTPEGVDLQVELADVGARIGAFAIDLIVITLILIAAAFALGSMSLYSEDLAVIIFVLIAFLLRSFYFTLFELGRRAATPGKMALKIRVAARGKARLSAASVFARNALREIGFFLSIGFIFGLGAGGVDGWMSLLATICIFAKFAFTPEQIDTYGIKELHVLEDVLRAQDSDVLKDVASRIRTKIGWVWEASLLRSPTRSSRI